jgi:threonine/homoserine/homoserine lactone efflux protein
MLTLQWAMAVATYAFVSSITPGPNNTMLLASGVNFGVRRTLPHLFGISCGFGFMTLMLGTGLHQVFVHWPLLLEVLRYLGVTYMVYLAYRIATSAPPSQDAAQRGKPLSFLGAAAFQWVNIKAVFMAITAITVYASSDDNLWPLLALVGLFSVVNLGSCFMWVVFGASMRRWLQEPKVLRVFNAIMALALLASLVPMLQA